MFEYYFCLNLLLLPRLVYLHHDNALSRQENGLLFLGQVLLLGSFFVWNVALGLSCSLIIILGVMNGLLERRVRVNAGRVIVLVMLLVGIDLIENSTGGLRVRPGFLLWTHHYVQVSSLLMAIKAISAQNLVVGVFGILVLTNEINALIRLIFYAVGIEPRSGGTSRGKDNNDSDIDTREFNAGRVIGFLERWLIYLVILTTNEYAAIGFIIAAKGLARMKQLEEKEFAEYMLIGTFLSVLSAVLVGKWVLWML